MATTSRPILNQLKTLELDKNARCQELACRWTFYAGRQHDHLKFTWDGESRDPNLGYLRERLKPVGFSIDTAGTSHKKPDTPVPLARQIVSRFTEMLLSHENRPQVEVPQDEATQDFLDAVFQEANLWEVLAQARDHAGAVGSAAIACGVLDGTPFAEVLHTAHLWVPEWDETKPGWVPKVVVEQLQISKDVINPDTGKLESEAFWRTRAWTDQEVVLYQDVQVRGWSRDDTIPIKSVTAHKFNRCPVFWVQNTLNAKYPEGDPDCEGTWELLDQVDRENTIVHGAIRKNTAPTVVIRDSKAEFRRPREIVKGKIIDVSADGGVDYLEMNGQSIEIGLKGVDALTLQILRTTECIVLDPEQAKAYNSGESMQMLWRSMESKASRLRVMVDRAVKEQCKFWANVGVTYGVDGESGMVLPPRRIKNDDGEDTWGNHSVKEGLWMNTKYPPFWTLTPKQIGEVALGLGKAVGGKENPAFMSVNTAARKFARLLGEDPDVEAAAVEQQHQEQLDEQQVVAEAQNELDKELAKAKPVPKPAGKG